MFYKFYERKVNDIKKKSLFHIFNAKKTLFLKELLYIYLLNLDIVFLFIVKIYALNSFLCRNVKIISPMTCGIIMIGNIISAIFHKVVVLKIAPKNIVKKIIT